MSTRTAGDSTAPQTSLGPFSSPGASPTNDLHSTLSTKPGRIRAPWEGAT